MRFAASLAPFAILASTVAGQLAVLQGVLTGIQTDVVAYGNAFTNNDPATILAAGDRLLATATAGIATANAATAVNVLEAVALRSTIQSLASAVDVTYSNAVSRKAAVVALGIQPDVLADFREQKTTVGALSTAVVAKVPAAVQPIAQGYVDQINASINSAITSYSS